MLPAPIRALAFATLVLFMACGGGGSSSAPPPPSQAPAISAVTPTHGSPGTTVVLAGTNLLGVSAVSFNGQPAFSYTVVSASEVDAVVPANAATGTFQVTTSQGSASSPAFTVDAPQAPGISSFTPALLSPGTVVTLTGCTSWEPPRSSSMASTPPPSPSPGTARSGPPPPPV